MAKIKITAALIKEPPSIPAGSRKLRITDTEIRGFTAEFWRSGTAVFWLKYTDQDSRTREVKIGRSDDISVEQARRKAKDFAVRSR
ncbi:integrase arm-type DNA-binding domain-containing protein [Azospirillum palustre]